MNRGLVGLGVGVLAGIGIVLVNAAKSPEPVAVDAPVTPAIQVEGEQASDGGYDFTPLDAALERMLIQAELPGVTMLVLRDGEVVYDRSIGEVDGTTGFTIGSASKWQSAVAIMSLVEEGLLDLDAPLSTYVPSFNANEIKSGITLRQALSHQTGLNGKHKCLREYKLPLASCVDQIADAPLVYLPGAKFGYGSLSFHVAAGAAENATGQTWREIYQSRVAQPLGMKTARFGRGGKSANPGIAGNLYTSRDDYARFLEMFRNYGEIDGVRILSEATVREMERGQVPAGLPTHGHVPERHQVTRHAIYGLGVWRDAEDEQGNLLVSSSPGKFGFTPWIDRRLGLVAVLATEYDSRTVEDTEKPDPSAVIYQICNIVDQADRGPQPQPNQRCLRAHAREPADRGSPAPGEASN